MIILPFLFSLPFHQQSFDLNNILFISKQKAVIQNISFINIQSEEISPGVWPCRMVFLYCLQYVKVLLNPMVGGPGLPGNAVEEQQQQQ